jgi:Uma2 family endonuclease
MRVAEFLHWNPPDQCRWQLIDGKPFPKSLANRTRGALRAEISTLLRNHLAAGAHACFVLMSIGVIPRVQPDINFRVADVAVTFAGYEEEQYAVPDPTLIVEILSPTNQAETWTNVWAYTTIPSVKEILIIHTAAIGADLLRRNPDGTWPERPITLAASDDLVLNSIGFRVPLTAAYATTRLAAR